MNNENDPDVDVAQSFDAFPLRSKAHQIREALRADPYQNDLLIARQLGTVQSMVWHARKDMEKRGQIAVIPPDQRKRQRMVSAKLSPERKLERERLYAEVLEERERLRGEVNERRAVKQAEIGLSKMTNFILNACDHIEQMEIPPLPDETRNWLVDRLREGEKALRATRTRLNGERK